MSLPYGKNSVAVRRVSREKRLEVRYGISDKSRNASYYARGDGRRPATQLGQALLAACGVSRLARSSATLFGGFLTPHSYDSWENRSVRMVPYGKDML